MPFENVFEDGQDEGQDQEQQGQGQVERLTAERLSQATEAQVRSKVLAEFMKDPLFSKLSEARINQKKVHILTDEELAALRTQRSDELNNSSSNEQEPDLESMDKKQLVGYMLKQLSSQVDSVFAKRNKPIEDQVEQLNGMAEQIAKREAMQEVQTAQQKYPDFDKYRDKMLALRQGGGQGLSVEQLYLLSKAQSGGLIPKSARADTERPSGLQGGSRTKKRDHTSDAISSLIRNKASEMAENVDFNDYE